MAGRYNEGKAIDAVLRRIEARDHALRANDGRSPDDLDPVLAPSQEENTNPNETPFCVSLRCLTGVIPNLSGRPSPGRDQLNESEPRHSCDNGERLSSTQHGRRSVRQAIQEPDLQHRWVPVARRSSRSFQRCVAVARMQTFGRVRR